MQAIWDSCQVAGNFCNYEDILHAVPLMIAVIFQNLYIMFFHKPKQVADRIFFFKNLVAIQNFFRMNEYL